MHRISLVCLLSILACGSKDPPTEGSTGEASESSSESTAAESSSGGSGNENPIVEATIDASAACSGASKVTLTATRFACVGAGPCTISNPPSQVDGMFVVCPSDESAAILTVDLALTGRYHVELVATAGDGTETRECYSADGTRVVTIGEGELASRPTIVVTSVGGPC